MGDFQAVRLQTARFLATYTQTDVTKRITLLRIHAQGNNNQPLKLCMAYSIAIFSVLL